MPAGWMIDDQDSARNEIVARAKKLTIASDPDKASHNLGPVTLADGRVVNAWAVHSVDPVIISEDGQYVALIKRTNPPGKGMPALPGGFIDPVNGAVETAVQAAVREASEEVQIDLSQFKGITVGARNMDRPDDIRVAKSNALEGDYGIKEGDVFIVSAQPVLFIVPNHVMNSLVAGDDAEKDSAKPYKIADLKREQFGIPLHFDQIQKAVAKMAEVTAKPKHRRGPVL